jgi:FixJ family two-component response regulator
MEIHRESRRRDPLVVVIDDDAAVRNSLKFSLEVEGYAVSFYADGAEALAADNLVDCACFVIDQNMPGMTGLEVADRLRERRISVPVILVTSHPNAVVRERALRARIPIVEKPLLGNALIERIRAIVGPTPQFS